MSDLMELIDDACGLAGSLGYVADMSRQEAEYTCRMELALFLVSLACADGRIGWDEAKVISIVQRVEMTPQEIGQFVDSHDAEFTTMESRVPKTFAIFAASDAFCKQQGDLKHVGAARTLMDIYMRAGKLLAQIDENVTADEAGFFGDFIGRIDQYLSSKGL